MGNSSTKVMPKPAHKNEDSIEKTIPPPLSSIAIWKSKMATFMQNHIIEMQNYEDGDLNYIQYQLKRLKDGHGLPFRTKDDERYNNAITEVTQLMTFIGQWHIMYIKACELINSYVAQQRQDDMEEIAFIFCIMVIEPQIVKRETR